MNFEHLFIRDVDGERRIEARQLPLRIGTGSDSEIRLPGPGGGHVALLDILDGAPFVQPVGRVASISLNGELLETSRRLADGDEISYYGSRIRVRADERLELEVQLEDSAFVTRPPESSDDAAHGPDQAIQATAFRRATESTATQLEAQSHVLRNSVVAGLGFLLLASYLLFSAKSVEFNIQPVTPDKVSVDGGWFRLPLGNRVLLRQGEYRLRVEKEGYYDVEQDFVVDEAQSKTVSVTLRKLPGKLTVGTIPPGTGTVSIDDTFVGPAPLGPVELQPGEHSLQVESERYLPYTDIIQFAGMNQNQHLQVQLVPGWADVHIDSLPQGAQIYSGEKLLGTTPAVVELMEGSHPVSVIKDSYKAWDGTVIAVADVAQELPLVRLEAADASLRVNSIPRGANVMVNGRYRGQSPVTLDLAPDIDYEIGLSKAGYGTSTRKVRLASAAKESITVDLSARTGSIKINVAPADATVFVDGTERGRGTLELQLSSAPHRIEVRKSGYESWSRTVTPRPGYPQIVTAKLRSDEEVARSKIDPVVQTAGGKSLRRVEPGTFMMGSSRSEQGRRANEVLLPVRITRPYYISTQEVTNKEFAEFMPTHDSGSAVHATLAGDQNPVANVTWAQAAEYCNFLSAREGLTPVYQERFGSYEPILPFPDGYRLPTEAEWAWAVRFAAKPTATRYAWGDDWPPKGDAGNIGDKSAADLIPSILPNYNDGFAATAPVGSFKANALGIFDGGGNVAEWVNDFYTVPAPGLKEPLADPVGPVKGSGHVIRGSSWKHAGMTELRQSYRDYGEDARTDLGFRIARNAD
ncbi:MAG TPA: PEGA domain-containing protein [Woeseiaceae bacterium]|nr:PEGA domain-containing protein [Woeseiaceae bacterium]